MPRYREGDAGSALERAVRILEAFDPRTTSLSVSDLARRTGLPLSTASRLIAELVRLELLQRDERRRVRIGLRLWEIAARAAPTRELREAALPFMEDLHAVLRHHTQLGVMDQGDVLFVERLSYPGSVVNVTEIAGRLPLHASSAGLVLLAHASAEQQQRVLGGPLRRYTAATITRPDELRAMLAQIRRQGFAYAAGHIHPQAAGVAVPVRDPADRVVAALGVVVPNEDSAIRAVPALRAAARGIARAIGGGQNPSR